MKNKVLSLVATKNKLQTAMEAALGTQAGSCSSYSSGARCYFGYFYCYAYADGSVSCDGDCGGCVVGCDGTSVCD